MRRKVLENIPLILSPELLFHIQNLLSISGQVLELYWAPSLAFTILTMLSVSLPQRAHKQSSNLAAHESKARTFQQYEEPVNYRSAGDLNPPTILAEPPPPNFEGERLPTFAKHHISNTIPLIAPASQQKAKHRPSRSSNEFTSSRQPVFTPAQVYPITTSRSTTTFIARKSASSPLLFDPDAISPPPYSKQSLPQQTFHHMSSDTEDDRDDVGMIYTSPRIGSQTKLSQSLRSRIFRLASTSTQRVRDKPISTTPGVMCAGETETETDEPVSIISFCTML